MVHCFIYCGIRFISLLMPVSPVLTSLVFWVFFNPFPGSWLSAGVSSKVPISTQRPKSSVSWCQWYVRIYILGYHGFWIAYSSFSFSLMSVFGSLCVITNHQCIEKYVIYLGFNFIALRETLKICSQWYVWNSDS